MVYKLHDGRLKHNWANRDGNVPSLNGTPNDLLLWGGLVVYLLVQGWYIWVVRLQPESDSSFGCSHQILPSVQLAFIFLMNESSVAQVTGNFISRA